MKKVDGVTKVQVSLKDGLTMLELRAGNKVTLVQLRNVIKNNGFVSKDAQIVAAGSVAGDTFVVSGTGERLPFAQRPAASGATWQFSSPRR